MRRYAGALIETQKGIALQLRDDKPDVTNPGKICNFGGWVEDEETPIQATIRELKEEVELSVRESDLEEIKVYKKTSEKDGVPVEIYIYLVRNVDADKLVIHEGEAIHYFKLGDSLDNPKFIWVLKPALENYLEKCIKN